MNRMKKEELLDEAYRLGFEYEKGASYCAQATVAALQDVFNIKNDDVFKASCGLSGGVGACGEGTCGAVAGGVLILSYLFGRNRTVFDFGKVNHDVAELSATLLERFKKEYDGSTCRETQKKLFGKSYNLRDEKERAEFLSSGGHHEKCPKAVGTGARLTAEIIFDEFEKMERP
jgi:C_GCAxxG_C_C family probable redox protein